jgi:hypothetical protein
MVARRREDGAGGGVLVARRGHEAEERKGGHAHVADKGEKLEGEEKGVRWQWGALLSGRGEVGGTVHGRRHAASVGRRGVADSGPAAALMGGAWPAPKQGGMEQPGGAPTQ